MDLETEEQIRSVFEDFRQLSNEPAHEIMVLITYATSKGSGESPEPSLFAYMKYGSRRRVRPKIGRSCTGWLRMCI